LRLGKCVPEESNVLLLLNDGLGKSLFTVVMSTEFKQPSRSEFIISDLALASQSIPSFTVSSLSLLSAVLLNHPPSTIVVDADLLPHLLELIYDAHEHGHHTVVVVGDLSAQENLGKISSHVNLVRFSDIEKEDPGAQFTLPPKIGESTRCIVDRLFMILGKTQILFLL
jgi:long-chain acyl-CoA synthetase